MTAIPGDLERVMRQTIVPHMPTLRNGDQGSRDHPTRLWSCQEKMLVQSALES